MSAAQPADIRSARRSTYGLLATTKLIAPSTNFANIESKAESAQSVTMERLRCTLVSAIEQATLGAAPARTKDSNLSGRNGPRDSDRLFSIKMFLSEIALALDSYLPIYETRLEILLSNHPKSAKNRFRNEIHTFAAHNSILARKTN